MNAVKNPRPIVLNDRVSNSIENPFWIWSILSKTQKHGIPKEKIGGNKDIVIWTAGVKPNLSYSGTDEIIKKFGRILVNNNLQIENHKNCFAIGDISVIEGMEDLPITAQVAMQEGNHLANNLELLIQGKDPLPYEFQDNGEMISLGIGEASISGLGDTLSGKLALEARRLKYASKLPDITESLKSASSWIFQKKSIFKKFLKKDDYSN